ncbi:MAG: tetratricopeptide repeat protein [Candidatus Levybacteria bacterium]|jgi:tetratricopeptide (TPR) repeat protein|nr:tetratricopeptide repeat protein [Candidatus Levybacteria bacterium]
MSLIPEKVLVIQGERLENKSVWQEDNIVLHGTVIKNRGQIRAQNRITIIGLYLSTGSASLISARKVEHFSSISDLLEKIKQYAAGTIQGKSVDDSREIMNHLLRLPYELLLKKMKKDSVREDFFSLYLGYKPDDKTCRITLSLIFHFVGLDFNNQKIPGKGYQDALILLEAAYAFYPDNEHIRKNLLIVIANVCLQYVKGEIVGKGYRDAHDILERFLAIEVGQSEMKNGISKIAFSLSSVLIQGKGEVKSMQEIYELIKWAAELDPENLDAQELLAFYSGQAFKNIGGDEAQVQDSKPDHTKFFERIKKYFCELIDSSDFTYSEDISLHQNIERAVEHFLAKHELHPDDAKFKLILTNLYDQLSGLYVSGQIEGRGAYDGMQVLEKAHSIDPNSIGIRAGLSVQCYLSALLCIEESLPGKTLMDGAKFLERSLEFKANLRDSAVKTLLIACNRYARAYNKGLIEGKTATDAIRLLELTIEIDPNYATSYYNLGAILLSQNDNLETLEKIRNLFEKCLSLEPNSDFFKRELAAILKMISASYVKEANKTIFDMLKVTEKSYSLNPDDKDIRSMKASFCYRIAYEFIRNDTTQGSLEEGLAYLSKVIMLEEDLDSSLHNATSLLCNDYAVACLHGQIEEGTMEDVIFLLGMSLRLDPTLLVAHQNLMQIYVKSQSARLIIAETLPDYLKIIEASIGAIRDLEEKENLL